MLKHKQVTYRLYSYNIISITEDRSLWKKIILQRYTPAVNVGSSVLVLGQSSTLCLKLVTGNFVMNLQISRVPSVRQFDNDMTKLREVS